MEVLSVIMVLSWFPPFYKRCFVIGHASKIEDKSERENLKKNKNKKIKIKKQTNKKTIYFCGASFPLILNSQHMNLQYNISFTSHYEKSPFFYMLNE